MPTLSLAVTVDARGLNCPMPIVRTAQAMKHLSPRARSWSSSRPTPAR